MIYAFKSMIFNKSEKEKRNQIDVKHPGIRFARLAMLWVMLGGSEEEVPRDSQGLSCTSRQQAVASTTSHETDFYRASSSEYLPY